MTTLYTQGSDASKHSTENYEVDFDEMAYDNESRLQILTQLRASWAQVLGQDQSDISDQDVFFDLGGDSISALELVGVVRNQCILLTVEQIFIHASLEEMASVAKRVKSSASQKPDQATSIEPFALLGTDGGLLHQQVREIAQACGVLTEQIQQAYPCTPMQESLVASTQGSENAYLLQMVYEMDCETPLDLFQRAWEATVQMNPVLRTRICQLKGAGFIQAVLDEDVFWNTIEMDVKQFLQDDARLPSILGGRLFRYAIVSQGQSRHFVWTVHHALCDGASVFDILDQVSRRFRNEPVLPHVSYEQYVKSVLTTDTTREREFWRQSLSGVSPASYPPVPHASFQSIPSSRLTSCLTINCISHLGITKSLLLRAAWGLLLSHHTGNDDVVFGTIVNGRVLPDGYSISHITGPTICLLPIALHIDPKESVASYLTRVRKQAAELMSFETTGLAKIRKYLADGLSSACDFQCLFVVHPEELGQAAAPALKRIGLKSIPHLGKTEQHDYPLVISAAISSNTTISLKLEYDERIISGRHANNLINQFQAVLNQLSDAAAETLVGSINPLNEEDLSQIRNWNKSTPSAIETCFHHLFEEQVYKYPTAAALSSTEQTLTYAEVQNIASACAIRLVTLGVGPETFVAVCFEKSIWAVIAMLAIFKAGGAYVPIDPAHPRGRISEIIAMARVKVALVSPLGRAVLEGLCDHVISLDNVPVSFIPGKRNHAPGSRSQPSDTAYLLFTSGTTGRPKGVVIPHSALCTGIVHQARAFGLGPKTRMFQFANYTFDASVLEIFATLAVGGTLCVPSERDRLDNLVGTISSLNVNTAVLTSTVLSLMSPVQVPTIKAVILGGEPLNRDLVQKWANHVMLTNGYGPSETTVCCGANIGLTVDSHALNIGRSIGATMWIVRPERHDQLSAIGCVGEIVVSGALLAKGYYGDKATTDASFVGAPKWLTEVNPQSSFRTIYKTGDLARYNSDGSMQYVGRKDNQVKLRGFRIELGDIESHILNHDLDSQANMEAATLSVALLPTEGLLQARIVAVVSFDQSKAALHLGNRQFKFTIINPRKNKHLDQKLNNVKSHLAFMVPDYMVPSAWVVLEELPLLVSGKIDRKAIMTWIHQLDNEIYQDLVSQYQDGDVCEDLESFVPGSLAHTLREIWGEVLDVSRDRIGLRTSFYSLGGDSISAIQVVDKARNRGMHLTVRGILMGKTLGALMAVVAEGQSEPSVALEERLPDGPFDLSPIQRLFVASNQSNMPGVRFHQATILRLRRSVSVKVLEDAISTMAERHPMLRAHFPGIYRWQKQVISNNPKESHRFRYHGEVTESHVRNILETGHDSISVDTGPTFSVDVYQISGDTHLFLTAHRLVVDLVSWRVIIQDIEDLVIHGSLRVSTGCSFFQWTRLMDARFTKVGISEQWVPQGENEKHMGLRLGSHVSSHNTHETAATAKWSLEQTSTSDLLQIARQNDLSSPLELMIAAVAKSFAQVFRRTCPSIFVEGHGREPLSTGVDLAATVGWFTILYPVDGFPAAGATLADYINHIKSARIKYPDDGLEFFSRKVLHAEDPADLKNMTWPIQFNYQGIYQQPGNDGSLFEWIDYAGLEDTMIGPNVKRLGIFEIGAVIRDRCLEFSLSYPRHIEHAALVLEWFQQTKLILEALSTDSSIRKPPSSPIPSQLITIDSTNDVSGHECEQTLSLGGKDYGGGKVQAVYACSPFQCEIIKQQAVDPSCFLISWEMEITSQAPRQPVNLGRVVDSWNSVVRKHAILRTRFTKDQTPNSQHGLLQIVLTDVTPQVIVDATLADFESNRYWANEKSLHACHLPHRIRFCQRGEAVVGYLEASHLILDGWSLGLIQHDLLAAYNEGGSALQSTSEEFGLPYESFIAAHESDRAKEDSKHWISVLHGQRPCILSFPSGPMHVNGIGAGVERTVINLQDLNLESFSAFSATNDVTVATIFYAAWAQTLSYYTRSRDVVFGYVVSGRDRDDVSDPLKIVGPLTNILACHLRHVSIDDNPHALARLACRIQEQRVYDGAHTLYRIQEIAETQVGGGQLFNTAVNFQRQSELYEKGGISIRNLSRSRDPWHFDVLLRIVVDRGIIRTRVEFNATRIDPSKVNEVANFFWKRLSAAILA
ncbi:putative HC-toxin synthetase [Seiridium cardinale]